mmetsp:Transcript_15729/g.20684  ORF Transcript_15729/g.20684 Transcript_15729/m.20684 type:complete len:127 (+) Transcript_15729:2-382(+)
MVKLGFGYEQVQQSSIIMGHLICAAPGLYYHIKKQLSQNSSRVSDLCSIPGISKVIKELADTLAGEAEPETMDPKDSKQKASESEESPLAVMYNVGKLKHRLLEIHSILGHEKEWGATTEDSAIKG